MNIRSQFSKGVYKKDIARELEVSPKTISRALKRNGAPKNKRNMAKYSKLDSFKSFIDKMLSENIWNSIVIFRELQDKGYNGGITILRNYILPKRVMRKSKATVRFETEPGQQMQSDWGKIKVNISGKLKTVYFIVNILGYSRKFHFWATDSADAEHTHEGISLSFEYFGGVTQEVLVDNQKAAVLANTPDKKTVFNKRFVDLAAHCGFTPKACRPYRARTKGKDERMVSYIKHNFFVRYRQFESLSHLNQLALQWLSQEADKRVHGTTKKIVNESFALEKNNSFKIAQKKIRYQLF